MFQDLNSYHILLASSSPRRISLLKELGLNLTVVDAGHVDEIYPPHLRRGEIALYLAEHKSAAYECELKKREILITADTIVWHRDRELGKPADLEEATQMITELSGSTHQVYTGVCLRSISGARSFTGSTDVTFSKMSPGEIEYYVAHYRPFDKAGSYGIQEWIGFIAVEEIRGSYFNVMGLPVQKVYSELKKMVLL